MGPLVAATTSAVTVALASGLASVVTVSPSTRSSAGQLTRGARLTGEPVDLDDVADSDLLLAATSADDRVHRRAPCVSCSRRRAHGNACAPDQARYATAQSTGPPREGQTAVKRSASERPAGSEGGVDQPDDPVRDELGLGEVVRDVDGGGAEAVEQVAYVDGEPVAQVAVEGAERLVEQQQPWARAPAPGPARPAGPRRRTGWRPARAP